MRSSFRTSVVLAATFGLVLAGCADGKEPDGAAAGEADSPSEDQVPGDSEALGELPTDQQDPHDPNDDVEDGVYRGNGVVLPIPEGWSISLAAFQQGVVAALPEDGGQQLTAQALDVELAEAAGAPPIEFESLLDGLRGQTDQDPEFDEEVELAGANRASRLTYLDLPSQQEGQPGTSVTIVLAESSERFLGEFVYSATSQDYDEAIASQLVEVAGFDPDSVVPVPAPGGAG